MNGFADQLPQSANSIDATQGLFPVHRTIWGGSNFEFD